MKDEMKQSNSTYTRNKVLVRMESAVSSVTSTQELVEPSTNAKGSKLRAMLSKCPRQILLGVIFLLAIGILTITTLYVLEYHKVKQTTKAAEEQQVALRCVEYPLDIVLDKMPPEVSDLLPKLESKIMAKAQAAGVKAASFGIAYQGKLWWTFNFGRMNFTDPNSTSPNSNTPYPVASLTKLATAVMLMKLLENDVIRSLDDPINKYDPEFIVKNPFNQEHITFRQLLCMTTGLPREAPCNPPSPYDFCPYNTTVMWKRISDIELQLRPNLMPAYSNLGYAVLGRVMERILNGTTYEEWIEREVINKLGLTNSGFNVRKRISDIPVSADYDHKISRIIDWGWLRPASGLYSTINDLNKFVSVLLEGLNTTFIKKSSKRRIFSQEYESGLGCPLALWKSTSNGPYEKHYAFNGLTIRYTADVRLSPENTLATYGVFAHGGDYLSALNLNGEISNQVFTTVSNVLKKKKGEYKAPTNMEAYVGVYKLSSYWPLISKDAVIRIKKGKLNLQIEWFSADLTYISPWKLKSVYSYNERACIDAMTVTGLLNTIFHFTEPPGGASTSPGFYVRSISAFGYASFERV